MKNRMILFAVGVCLAVSMPAMAKSIKIHGYVTHMV